MGLLFGPVTFATRRGTKITFLAGVFTIPLTAYSLYSLYSMVFPGNSREGKKESIEEDLSHVE